MHREIALRLVAGAAALSLCVHISLGQNGKGNGQGNAGGPCVVNGKNYNNCPPALAKQAKREAARRNAAPQKKGVKTRFAGVSPAKAKFSPLATVSTTGTAGPTALAVMTPGVKPDYFGIGNYANSPLPQIDATGAVVAKTGMTKFKDTLPGLTPAGANNLGAYIPLAVADTSTFPGSDFYKIGIKEYSLQMHSDLVAPTPLRGYYDINNTADSANHYLGPLILATRNRPVRVLFQNNLTPGPLGHLPVPVDTTYMGAGSVSDGKNVANASDQRAVLHLHGGSTPWISDGTPHQWITPAGDAVPNAVGFAKGFSFQNAPDMLGVLGSTPSLTDGKGTYFWTNQQSGRLMFYHEHAYGTTRLGVYAGAAAGYLLVDPVQEAGLQTATAPGTIITNAATGVIQSADLAHMIPLIIQDKTFVPDSGVAGGQLAASDPTWDLVKWGGAGSLWFPHVYMPNQNPADITGANGFGRWDYGPWFWPPQNPGTFVPGGQPYQCTSIATPTTGWTFPPLVCPGTPLPSGTPEGFMDTMVVNGTAYPSLQVAPAAYRFQVLNASNDRALNLGLYVAEPVTLSAIITNPGSGYTAPTVTVSCAGAAAIATVGDGVTSSGTPFTNGITGITFTSQPAPGCASPTITIADTAPGTGTGAAASAVMSQNTEVKMVPAVPVTSRPSTMPNCPSALAAPMGAGGLVTALFDSTGKPLNGTGLPGGCWPLYSSAQGYTAGPFGENGGQLSWGNSDARIGGVPDPTTAGPPIIQIGSEGGLLPKPAVIPSTPISYDYNKRSITVLNVLNHGLLLGPAERADIIVDFSQFANKTLILYNDAPAPVPAGDPRIDYYTNGPDNSDSGGAPSTIAGYGPNTRTVMQIQVTGTSPNTLPFSLPTLSAALPNLFAPAQEQMIIPEPDYPAGNGNGPATYIPIQATSVNSWVGGAVGGLQLTSGGSGYASAPAVSISGGGGSGATATATIGGAVVSGLSLTNGGSGYSSAPTVTFSGGGGTGAAATATINRSVNNIAVTAGGSNYTSAPSVVISGGGGSGATATASTASGVFTVSVISRGSGYTTAPTVVFTGGGGSGAVATATVSNGRVTAVTVTNKGTGYTSAPAVSFTGGGGTGATATATITGYVFSVTVISAGSGYTSIPTVSFSGGGGSGATATASLNGVVNGITLTSGGSGYTAAPLVGFTGGGGTGAAATAAFQPGFVNSITLTNGGTGYTSAPTVAFVSTAGSGAQAMATSPSMPLLPKTIQELFTLDYGRMNATLGVEVPFTNFLTQTTIPYGYVDPPTEIFKDGETQLWKITHNGVDTHFIHFHLFTVQVINRVGWDGAIKPPDPNELGLKDTVRMNPLEDIIVALRPMKQTLPFVVPSSSRPMDVTMPVGSATPNEFTDIDPTNQPATVTNDVINFGWEYVWHCHILGHEENDMMRSMILAVAPNAPIQPGATLGGSTSKPSITVNVTSTAAVGTALPTHFTIQRAVVTAGVAGAWTTVGTVAATFPPATPGVASATFTDTTVVRRTTYIYQAIANNLVGYTKTYAAPAVGYPHTSADSAPSGPSVPVTTN